MCVIFNWLGKHILVLSTLVLTAPEVAVPISVMLGIYLGEIAQPVEQFVKPISKVISIYINGIRRVREMD